MKRLLITSLFAVTILFTLTAQSDTPAQPRKKHRFSPEQFQAKQRDYIIEKAKLTKEEADAFFPLFFELQKEKFRIEREAREKVVKERGQKLSDEQLKELLENSANAQIEIAKLKKGYIEKYLKVVSPKKLIDIQRAEHSFQSYIIKSMTRNNNHKEHKRTFGKRQDQNKKQD